MSNLASYIFKVVSGTLNSSTISQPVILPLAYSFSVCYLFFYYSKLISLSHSFLISINSQPRRSSLYFPRSFFISLLLPLSFLVSVSRAHALLLAPKRTNYSVSPLLERSRAEVAGISKIALIVGVIFSAGSELSERRSADNDGGCMRWLVDDPVL